VPDPATLAPAPDPAPPRPATLAPVPDSAALQAAALAPVPDPATLAPAPDPAPPRPATLAPVPDPAALAPAPDPAPPRPATPPQPVQDREVLVESCESQHIEHMAAHALLALKNISTDGASDGGARAVTEKGGESSKSDPRPKKRSRGPASGGGARAVTEKGGESSKSDPRPKKRARDPASGGGGSAKNKKACKKKQDIGRSCDAPAKGFDYDPPTSVPQIDAASDCAGGEGGLAGQDEREAGSVHPPPTDADADAVTKELQKAEAAGEINPNSSRRLKVLHLLLHSCYQEGLLTYETPGQDPSSARSSPEACILGWSKLLVKQPQELNLRIRKMVEEDQGGIWKKANGKYNQALKNPTWGVYELFRKIGAKPRFRGPAEGDPGKHDMFYYKEWEFRNDESFRNARLRLAKGFSYCPDKGSRARKRAPKQDPSQKPASVEGQ